MNERGHIPNATLDIRRRLLRAAAWYESARTTFEVLRLLDEETVMAAAKAAEHHKRFVPRPGFEV